MRVYTGQFIRIKNSTSHLNRMGMAVLGGCFVADNWRQERNGIIHAYDDSP
jgi:hypothetical protein